MYLMPFLRVDIARVLLTTKVQQSQKIKRSNELKFKSYQKKLQVSQKVKYHRQQSK